MKNSNLFWGGIFVALGILFILNNLDFLNFNWWGIFRLWPMLLVMLGVTLLPIKNAIKLLLTLIILAITILLLFTNTTFNRGPFMMRYGMNFNNRFFNEQEYSRKDQHFYEPYKTEIEEATIDVEAVAGEFYLEGSTDNLVDFRQDGNIGPYIFSTNIKGNHQYLGFDLKNSNIRLRKVINDVEIQLNTNPVWSINLESGAAKIELDLSKYKTREINIQGGASSTYIKLGDRFQKTNVTIESGASSITILVPEESGCELTTQTVLSSKNFEGFDRLDRGSYQTRNFETAKNKVYIDIEAAITSLKVRRY